MKRPMMLLLAIPLLLGAAPPGDRLKVGDRVTLYTATPNGHIPILEDEADYRGMLEALRDRRYPTPWLQWVVPPGGTAEILALRDDPSYALVAPVAKTRVVGGSKDGEIRWIAQQYLRPPGTPRPPDEDRLPVFTMVPDSKHIAEVGDHLNLHAADRAAVPCARDRPGLIAIGKGLATEGGERVAIFDYPSVVMMEIGWPVEVLGRVDRPIRAVHCRLTTEPHKGLAVWVPERFVAASPIKITYDNPGTKAKGKAKARGKRHRR